MLFFNPHLYVHDQGARPASVLALYSDRFLGEVRIKPYLNALLARGAIADYQAADRSMHLIGPLKSFRFTHIWCQRNISTAQFNFLQRYTQAPIIYDLDDLMTSVPEFVMKVKPRTQRRIRWCLQHARAVTVASEQLRTSLAEDIAPLAPAVVVLKNGCDSATAPAQRDPRKELIWTSGDRPFYLNEYPSFVGELAKLVNRAGYECILIGRFDAEGARLFERSRRIAYLDFVSCRGFLRSRAGAIAVAPLPSHLPSAAQRFFDAKSDIKLVDYLCSGLVPLCSSAVPYATSELFLPELAAADAQGLLERLEACIAGHQRMIEYVDESIHRPGLLRARQYSELSKVLDHLFA